MMGCYDFCGHYEWTFGWLDRIGGDELVRTYWDEAINRDSQRHTRDLIINKGFKGMKEYWGHTLAEESPDLGFALTCHDDVFRIDMHDCPSKGFLLKNGLENYCDYCDHCIGWIGPMLRDAGYVIDHEHNHQGQCWWEMRRHGASGGFTSVGDVAGDKDVRTLPKWVSAGSKLHSFNKANGPDKKTKPD